MSFHPAPLDLESLRCFEAAATHLSFRMAAEQVALSPAAFSDRIRRLEEELDARLFDRTTRRVRLTAAGERLLPEARACLVRAERCRAAAREPAEAAPVELTLGTRFELGMSWLTPELGTLEARRPGLTLHLSFGRSDDLVDQALHGLVDAVVTSARLSRPSLEHVALHPERYALVGAPDLLEERPLTAPEHAAAHALLDIDAERPLFRYLMDALPAATPMAFARTVHLGTIAAIRHRAVEGAGIAVLPWYFIQADVQEGRLRVLMPDVSPVQDYFRLVWRAGHPRAELLREIGAYLGGRPLR